MTTYIYTKVEISTFLIKGIKLSTLIFDFILKSTLIHKKESILPPKNVSKMLLTLFT